MSYAYTPGLKVKAFYKVIKTRRLPTPGEILVKVGDFVSPETIVATTKIPSEPYVVNVAEALQADPEQGEDITRYMVKQVGDSVEKGELIAQYSAWFGLQKLYCYAPITGNLTMVSDATGQAFIREPDLLFELQAHVSGTISEIIPEEAVVIETPATFIQGIFGIGGETRGEIKVINGSGNSNITAEQITPECAGKIVVGSNSITLDALKKAVEIGVKGVVVGGVDDKILAEFLGYEIGVAITGNEECGITFIITDGFGQMRMQDKVVDLLKSHEGQQASIDGATQIRAGVIRPEIIIYRKDNPASVEDEAEFSESGMIVGTRVRIISEPYFGAVGHVSALPIELRRIETESDVRILEVELEDSNNRVIIPRANVEIIEE